MNIAQTPMAVDKIDRIRKWLRSEERMWLEEAVRSKMAATQIAVLNDAFGSADVVIATDQLSSQHMNGLKEAARLKVFIDVLTELSDEQQATFETAQITI